MRKRLGIRTLILLMGLLPVTLLCLAFGFVAMHAQIGSVNQLMSDRARATTSEFSARLSPFLQPGSELSSDQQLQQQASRLLQNPGTRSLAIYDIEKSLLFQSGPAMPPPFFEHENSPKSNQYGQLYPISHPIYDPHKQNLLGWLQVGFNWHEYQLYKYQIVLIGTLGITGALILAVVLSLYINLRFNRDTKSIRRALQRLIDRDHQFHLQLPGSDSFSEIAHQINQLNTAQQNAMAELENSVRQGGVDLQQTLETLEIQNIELDLARKEALEASRIKSEFLANTTHELRTPLNAIIGFSNVVLKTPLDSRQQQSIESIRTAADNLLTIINDILDFSKLEAGKLVLDKRSVNLREILEEALQLQAPSAQEKQLDLILNIDADVPDTIESDGLRLKQIFINLISNAIKFTQNGHVLVSVSACNINKQSVALNFQVSDTGIGLSREQQKCLFRDFSQADASITRQYGGTGLGLVIVKRLVEQMQGEIGVESETGKGANFWINLQVPTTHELPELRPFASLKNKSLALYASNSIQESALQKLFTAWGMVLKTFPSLENFPTSCDYYLVWLNYDEARVISPEVDQKNTVIISPLPLSIELTHAILLNSPPTHTQLFDAFYRNSKPLSPKNYFCGNRVLLVDDNPANLLFLSDALSDYGIDTETAQNGPEAIQRCHAKPYDLILMDIQMPQLDGINTSASIRQQGENTHTPIVLVSAHLSPDNPLQMRNAGINDFISKPVTETQLQVIFERYLKRNPEPLNKVDMPSDSKRPVDIVTCLELAKQRPNFAKEMLELLLEELPEQIRQLNQAKKQGDWQAISRINHHSKGACCYTGVPLLKNAVNQLETALQSSNASQYDEKAVLTALENLLDEAEKLCRWRQEYDLDIVLS